MGYELTSVTVLVRVSRHNSERDRTDDADAAELFWRIQQIAAEHRYAHLDVVIEGGVNAWQ